jgi:hypothetical protein
MGIEYSVVNRTKGEYLQLDDWNTKTHGVVGFGMGVVVSMLAVTPAVDLDPLGGRWCGDEVTLVPDSGTFGDDAPEPFEDCYWVVDHLEDLTPAVEVMLDRLGHRPLPQQTIADLEAMAGDTFLRFARSAMVSGYEPVIDLLGSIHGNRWVERYRERSASRLQHNERLGFATKPYERFPGDGDRRDE